MVNAAVLVEITGASVFVIAQVVKRAPALGFDFRVNVWATSAAVLRGTPYYPPVVGKTVPSSFSAYPPLLGVVGIVLRPLGPHLALITWDAAAVAAFGYALWCVGVRDWRVFCLALGSLPFVAAIVLGQVSPFLALGTALAWRHRNRRNAPGLIAAVLIAIKLIAWPMLLWLVITRRSRAAAVGIAATVGLLIVPWAMISFDGLRSYPRLLIRSGESWGPGTHSIYSLVLATAGSSLIAKETVLLSLALTLAGTYVFARRGAELAAFASATAAGIYASPVVHPHYLLAVLVVLAIAKPRFSYAWILVLLLSVSPQEPPLSTWRLALGVCAGVVLAAQATLFCYQLRSPERSRRSEPSLAAPLGAGTTSAP